MKIRPSAEWRENFFDTFDITLVIPLSIIILVINLSILLAFKSMFFGGSKQILITIFYSGTSFHLWVYTIEVCTGRNPSYTGGLFRFFGILLMGQLSLGMGNEEFFVIHRPLGVEDNHTLKKSILR